MKIAITFLNITKDIPVTTKILSKIRYFLIQLHLNMFFQSVNFKKGTSSTEKLCSKYII